MADLLRFPAVAALSDADARADALDIHQSWVVEAPAGSGKTGLLIQRYLKLLADDSVTGPEQVLAITFTTKATAELRERVLMQLRAAAAVAGTANEFDRATRQLAAKVLIRDRALGWSLLDQPGRMKIKTIDAVCSEIASSLPLLSGSGGRGSPVEDAEALYALAARRTFLQLGGPDGKLHAALSDVLLHRDGNLADCERLLSGMLALRDQWGEFVPVGRDNFDDAWLDANVLPKLERALDQAICAVLTQLASTMPGHLLAQLTTAAAEMAHLEGYKVDVSPIAICAGRHKSPSAIAEDLAHWRALVHLLVTKELKWRKRFYRSDVKFELDKTHAAALTSTLESFKQHEQLLGLIEKLDSLPPARYPTEQWAVAKSLFRVLSRALVELQFVFAERGECDFTEVALAARTALTASDGMHDLEAALGIRLQHLLVDEMQDTSSSQYELIQTLTHSWDGHSQTVFLVGDPKQSIYLFRQARVERFLRMMRSGWLGDLPVGVLRLTANFRSQAALVDDFNADFSTIFPAASDSLHPEEVPYVHATAARAGRATNNAIALDANEPVTARVWHSAVLPFETDRIEKARNTRSQRLSDAAEACRIVKSWQSRPLPAGQTSPWTVAVLCRSRNHLDEIVAAFKGAAIPFRALDIDALKDRPEVCDLLALTRALLHPADRVAWLALLRAPWCGLSLSELHILTGADDPAWAERTMHHVIAERGHLLPDDACRRLQRLWTALEAAVEARARISFSQLVERTWRSLGGASYLDASELANANRFLQLLDEVEEAPGPVELSLLERRLDRLFAAPALQPDAVDLLTIHKAKGLEWDVVIVPALERVPPPPRDRLLTWVQLDQSDEESAHMLLAPVAGKGEDSHDLTKWIRGVESARAAAERKRLFYVACTRAREELHLFAAPVMSAKDEVLRPSTSLLAAAWPAAAPHFAAPEESPGPVALAASFEAEGKPEDSSEADIAASYDGAANDTVDAASRRATRAAPLQRLPLAFDAATLFVNEHRLRYGDQPATPTVPAFERPEGPLIARALGNAVHAFLEQITHLLAANEPPVKIVAGLPGWTPRVAAVLRSEGLQPAVVERLTQRVLFALETTLTDPTGLWLLSPHAGAASEYALTAGTSQRTNIRIDRIFHAGAVPLSADLDHLWVVDYKTTIHGPEGIEVFLADEKTRYAPQLEAYAAVLSTAQGLPATRLALYYPFLQKLIWWSWEG